MSVCFVFNLFPECVDNLLLDILRGEGAKCVLSNSPYRGNRRLITKQPLERIASSSTWQNIPAHRQWYLSHHFRIYHIPLWNFHIQEYTIYVLVYVIHITSASGIYKCSWQNITYMQVYWQYNLQAEYTVDTFLHRAIMPYSRSFEAPHVTRFWTTLL